jgi:hypothetical protein
MAVMLCCYSELFAPYVIERDQRLWDPISPSGNVGTFIPDQTTAPLGLIAFGLKLVLDPMLETDLGT